MPGHRVRTPAIAFSHASVEMSAVASLKPKSEGMPCGCDLNHSHTFELGVNVDHALLAQGRIDRRSGSGSHAAVPDARNVCAGKCFNAVPTRLPDDDEHEPRARWHGNEVLRTACFLL
jgi:hypothetical protein